MFNKCNKSHDITYIMCFTKKKINEMMKLLDSGSISHVSYPSASAVQHVTNYIPVTSAITRCGGSCTNANIGDRLQTQLSSTMGVFETKIISN